MSIQSAAVGISLAPSVRVLECGYVMWVVSVNWVASVSFFDKTLSMCGHMFCCCCLFVNAYMIMCVLLERGSDREAADHQEEAATDR